MAVVQDASNGSSGNHFSCSMTAVLIARVHGFGGDNAVAELLRRARTKRTLEYLSDTSNWISYDEAVALWRAGTEVTHHPQFARVVGEDAARRLNGSSVAALLRSLGSPEAVYRQLATGSTKFSTATRLRADDVGPGYAEIVAEMVDGLPRSADHCAWTCGLLTQPTVLFGLPPATVEHDQCAAFGAERCTYQVTWSPEEETDPSFEADHGLRQQLEAMQERLESMFATAVDLIGADDINEVLARITDRAALEVRAPRYLLAVRTTPGGEIHTHHKGFDGDEVATYAHRILDSHPAALPESWLVARVSSNRRDYGRLLAMYDGGRRFFPQERELLEVYARYAATALDSATALMEAQQRYAQSSALLELARELARVRTSGEAAQRLAEAVPAVVDCDRVAVYIWDEIAGELVRRATNPSEDDAGDQEKPGDRVNVAAAGGPLQQLLKNPASKPIFVQAGETEGVLHEILTTLGVAASMLVPLGTPDQFLGLLAVSVADAPERLRPTPDLLDRLSGVAAQATTALQNGRLLDQVTYQALHDQLTGLANRLQFTDKLRTALSHARQEERTVTLFYLDLDSFKPVNDEFGHDVGDDLLVAVGERLRACTRADDTVARLGGDEFAVLIDARTDPADTTALARRLAGAFTERFIVGGRELHLGASIGYAQFPADADTPDGLLRVADGAMFEAKRAHKAGIAQILARG